MSRIKHRARFATHIVLPVNLHWRVCLFAELLYHILTGIALFIEGNMDCVGDGKLPAQYFMYLDI